jgi:hypothetical protein
MTILFIALAAVKVYEAPWCLRLGTVYDRYVLFSWLVLVVTIPVFSMRVLGARPLLMTIAWLIFGPHICMNIYNLLGRVPNICISSSAGRSIGASNYAAFVAVPAVNSFPVHIF